MSRGPLNTGIVGAVSELVTCADLMRRGYHVFRAQSQACPCDLVIFKDDDPPIRIEVRSVTINPVSGNTTFPIRETDHPDVFALVVENVVGYLPEGIVTSEPFPFLISDGTRARAAMAVAGEYVKTPRAPYAPMKQGG